MQGNNCSCKMYLFVQTCNAVPSEEQKRDIGSSMKACRSCITGESMLFAANNTGPIILYAVELSSPSCNFLGGGVEEGLLQKHKYLI